MGVPQRRERVFFIALRKDLAPKFMEAVDMFTELPKIELEFNENEIPFKDFDSGKHGRKITKCVLEWYDKTDIGESVGNCIRRHGFKEKLFSYSKLNPNRPLKTILSAYDSGEFRHDVPNYLHEDDIIKGGSFPGDYNFLNIKTEYLIGMSVPPLMTGKIAEQIYKQWLSKIIKI